MGTASHRADLTSNRTVWSPGFTLVRRPSRRRWKRRRRARRRSEWEGGAADTPTAADLCYQPYLSVVHGESEPVMSRQPLQPYHACHLFIRYYWWERHPRHFAPALETLRCRVGGGFYCELRSRWYQCRTADPPPPILQTHCALRRSRLKGNGTREMRRA